MKIFIEIPTWLGDAIMTTPAIQNIIKTYPTAKITLLGSFVLMLCGHSIGDSMFEFASALGTVGFSAGLASSSAPQVVLWTSTIGMILGRLEIFVILMAAIRIKSGIKKPFRR